MLRGVARVSSTGAQPQPRYCAVPISPTTISPYTRYNLVIIVVASRGAAGAVIALLPAAALERRRSHRGADRRQHDQDERGHEPDVRGRVADDGHAVGDRVRGGLALGLDPQEVAARGNLRQRDRILPRSFAPRFTVLDTVVELNLGREVHDLHG